MKQIGLFFIICFALSCCQNQGSKRYEPLNSAVHDVLIEINDDLPSFMRQNIFPVIIPIVEKQIYRTDSLFEYYSYIPLETCEEGLVGNIKKICADENYLFVLDTDNQKVVQFDTAGRFVRSIGSRGRGPHEYTEVCDMALDKKRRVICLLDAGAAKLLFYDYDGKCVKEESMYYMFSEMAFIDTLRVHHVGRSHNEGIPAVDLFHLIISNDNQVPLFCDFPMSETHRRSFYYSLPNPLSESADGVYYNTPLSDTLWRITPRGCEAAYVLKFPDRESSFTSEEAEMMTSDDYFKRKREMDTYGGNLHVTSCFVYFYLLGENQHVSSVLYNRKSGNVRRYEITELPPLERRRLGDYYANSIFQHMLGDSVLAKVLQPYEVISRFKSGDDLRYYNALCEEDRRMLDSWTEEGNPVLMLAKPRSF